MSQKVKEQSKFTKNKMVVGAVVVISIVVAGISGLWYVKSGAFRDVMVSVLDKKGGPVEAIEIGVQKLEVSGAIVMSRLNSIKRSGFPFEPGVTIDADVTILPEGGGISNKSFVRLPLKAFKVQSSLFSTSDISIWMPKLLEAEVTDARGSSLRLVLKNRAMVLKLVGGLESTEMLLQAVDLDVAVGDASNEDHVMVGSVSLILEDGLVEKKGVVNIKQLVVDLADKDAVNFENIAYMGTLKNKPLMDIEMQRLIAVLQAAPNDLEVLRGLVKQLAEASTSGELNLRLAVKPDSYLSVKSYMNRDERSKDNIDMQAVVTAHGLEKITNNLLALGISQANIQFVLSMFRVVAEKSEIDGVEHLSVVVSYNDYSVKLNGKEIINIDTSDNSVTSFSNFTK